LGVKTSPPFRQFKAARPARHMQLVRHLDQPPERDPLQRHGMAAERVQVDAVLMIGFDHPAREPLTPANE
jgi:hypothetical protein